MKISITFARALGMVLLAVYLAFGVRYALYTPARSATFLWGVYHVHSTASDGLESAEEIARQARAAGVSLILMTDHRDPHLKLAAFRKEIEGVVVVGGSEVRLPEGRLTIFGTEDAPQFHLSSFPPAAMEDIRARGGFPVVAYPDDALFGWHYWGADLNPSGIEILNLFTSLRSSSFLNKVGLALFYPFSHYYFLKSISFPEESIAHWDKFLETSKTWGFVATDAHGGFHLGRFAANLPSYTDSFSFVGLGIDKRYAAEPEMAIRRGDFFNCIRGAGEPDSFQFNATNAHEEFFAGSTAPAGSTLHARVEIENHAVRLVLKKDGATLSEVAGNALDVPSAEPGVYRVEAYLPRHELLPPNVPWIVSNPIFIGTIPPRPRESNRFARHEAALTQHDADVVSGAVVGERNIGRAR
jgi:hypothetical protein